ncbi:hypothetical protein AVEN_252151-1, partial [Araneus ventricosus]
AAMASWEDLGFGGQMIPGSKPDSTEDPSYIRPAAR